MVSHGWYRLAPFRWSAEEHVLRRAELLDGRAVDLTISFRDGALVVDHESSDELRTKLTRMFQLHVDTSEFVSKTRSSPVHQWVEASGFGRLLCGATFFEDAVKIIATTNVTWGQTVRMVELLVEKCGRRTASGHAAFPTPEDVARFTAEELQQDCRLGYRARTMHALAAGFASGELHEPIADPDMPTEELAKRYQALPGIGPYGAAHLLAMEGRHDRIAVDTEFRRFVRERYHGGRAVSDKTLLRRYARWGRWQYLAYWSELWESAVPATESAETANADQ